MGNIILQYGRHKGKSFEEISKIDHQYLVWLAGANHTKQNASEEVADFLNKSSDSPEWEDVPLPEEKPIRPKYMAIQDWADDCTYIDHELKRKFKHLSFQDWLLAKSGYA